MPCFPHGVSNILAHNFKHQYTLHDDLRCKWLIHITSILMPHKGICLNLSCIWITTRNEGIFHARYSQGPTFQPTGEHKGADIPMIDWAGKVTTGAIEEADVAKREAKVFSWNSWTTSAKPTKCWPVHGGYLLHQLFNRFPFHRLEVVFWFL